MWPTGDPGNISGQSAADQPPTQTNDAYQQMDGWDSKDELPLQYQTVESLSSQSYTIQLNGSKQDGSTKDLEDRFLFAVTMDLAPLLEPPTGPLEFFLVPDEAAPGMNVNVQIIGENFTSIDAVTTSNQLETRITQSAPAVASLEKISQEREDEDNDLMVQTLLNVTTLNAVTNTFTVEAHVDENDQADTREYNAIFALNLDRFANHVSAYTPGAVTPVTTPGVYADT